MSENDTPTYDYVTFPRQFLAYKWYKPILVALLTFVFMLVFQMILVFAGLAWIVASTGTLDLSIVDSISDLGSSIHYTGPGTLMVIGGVATMLPALVLAILIVRDRPFSSYSSSRGGWNWGAFLKCLGVAFVVYTLVIVVQIVLFPDENATRVIAFNVIGFILCTLLVPFQCMAEEYVFRGLVLQTVGAWTRLPFFAMVVSALLFAAMHMYNLEGMIAVFVSGVVWAALAWQTRGIESTCAAHIANNLVGFYAVGFGFQTISSDVDVASMVFAVIVDVIYAVVVILLGKKFNWFTSKGDGTAKANENYRMKMAQRQFPPQQYQPPMQGQPPASWQQPAQVQQPLQQPAPQQQPPQQE